jgi:hypothetical protein
LKLIREACETYKFTFTILPLEAIYDIDDKTDLRVSGQEEAKIIEEEKKRDEELHT